MHSSPVHNVVVVDDVGNVNVVNGGPGNVVVGVGGNVGAVNDVDDDVVNVVDVVVIGAP